MRTSTFLVTASAITAAVLTPAPAAHADATSCIGYLQQHHASAPARDTYCRAAEHAATLSPHRAMFNCLESMHRSGLDPAVGQAACTAAIDRPHRR